jgi:hypothetical protein
MTTMRLRLERVEIRNAGSGESWWRRLWLSLPRLQRECRVAIGVVGLY